MGWCLQVVSHDTFMLVIYCPVLQALHSKLHRGPAHTAAPWGKTPLMWMDNRGRGGAASCLIHNLYEGKGSIVCVFEERWLNCKIKERQREFVCSIFYMFLCQLVFSASFYRMDLSMAISANLLRHHFYKLERQLDC